MSKLKKILVIPDCHIPYEDKRAWALMMKAARAIKIDIIVIMGDFGDFYAVSSHDKNPNRIRALEAEVQAVNYRLDELDGLGASQKYFVTGNHEDRLERYLMTKAPELFNMVTIPDLFQLKHREWHYTPYREHVKVGKVYYTHDTGKAGGRAHEQAMADFQDNVIIGHCHRSMMTIKGNAKGHPKVGAAFGWLGDIRQVDYMHTIMAKRDWSLGFGIGYLMPESGITFFSPIVIVNYSCVIEGKLIKG